MVTEPRSGSRSRDARNGHGVTGRFRPLGSPTLGADPTPPGFSTAPWGYRRTEVDAWAAWVAGLVAHGQNETVRADSAEATLRATLERLEQMHGPDGAPNAGELPRRAIRGQDETARAPDGSERTTVKPDATAGPAAGPGSGPASDPTAGPAAATTAGPASEPTSPPPDADASTTDHPTSGAPTAASPELTRLHVVETTLCEVMRLLHRLVGPEEKETHT